MLALVLFLLAAVAIASTAVGHRASSGRQFETSLRTGYDR